MTGFLKEEFEYTIIDDLTVENLQEWCNENDISIQLHTNAERWCAFTQYYCREQNLDVISSASMGYIISSLFAGLGVSCNTEIYIREEELVFDAIEYLNQLREKYDDEETIAKQLFSYIFDLYCYHIHQYEYKDHNMCFRIGESSLARFEDVAGETKSEKFMNLIQYYFMTRD